MSVHTALIVFAWSVASASWAVSLCCVALLVRSHRAWQHRVEAVRVGNISHADQLQAEHRELENAYHQWQRRGAMFLVIGLPFAVLALALR